MGIITISREFGSGGREMGRRLAAVLGWEYYDKEILREVARRSGLYDGYVESMLEGRFSQYPLTLGRSFSLYPAIRSHWSKTELILKQNSVMQELAGRGSCVIVGRGADMVLRDENPFRIFVYADMQTKIERCRKCGGEGEGLSLRALETKIREIDKARAEYYKFLTGEKWGNKEHYDLCINTTELAVSGIAEAAAVIGPAIRKIRFRNR